MIAMPRQGINLVVRKGERRREIRHSYQLVKRITKKKLKHNKQNQQTPKKHDNEELSTNEHDTMNTIKRKTHYDESTKNRMEME